MLTKTRRFALGTGMLMAGMATKRTVWSQDKDQKELPIYDVPEEEIQYEQVPAPDTFLLKPISAIRGSLIGTYRTFESGRNYIVKGVSPIDSKAQDYREGRSSLLLARGENLLPGGVYVLVTALAGSLFVSKSNFLVRKLTPLLLGTVAFGVVYPKTTDALVTSFESKTSLQRPNWNQIWKDTSDLAYHRYTVIRDSFLGSSEETKEKKGGH
jgi:hypothetical protein